MPPFRRWNQSATSRELNALIPPQPAASLSDALPHLFRRGRRSRQGPADSDRSPLEVLDVGRKQTRDIGQPRLVLLASSSESLQSFTRGDTFPTDKGPYGVFTSFVLHAMMHLEAPVSADDVYQHASKGMEIFFGEAEQVHEPFLFENSNEPVYFKTK